jgi:glycosyltransferase involved in cell wall biosynthesis
MDYLQPPFISVCITTYNHEKFIEQTLEGVFMQKINYPVEVILYNDASSDRSDEIIRELIKDKTNVSYISQRKNKGISGNFTDSIKEAKGKYVAVLDGDDYWIDEHKLQKQIDFLESHPEYAACFTDTLVKNEVNERLTEQGALKSKHKRNISLGNLADGGFWIPTSTFAFRNELLTKPIPVIYQKIKMVDIFLFYLILEKGNLAFLDEVTAVYRKHDSGEWSGLDHLEKFEFRINNLNLMSTHFKEHKILGEWFKEQVKSQKRQKIKFRKRSLIDKMKRMIKKI